VECNVFGRGVCLAEFRAFDACFERAQASGGSSSAEEACMDKVGREGGLDQLVADRISTLRPMHMPHRAV
jgi:hypothetical protein